MALKRIPKRASLLHPIAYALCIAAFGSFSFSAGSAQAAQPLSIMTGTMANAVNWGIAAALKKKFFEEQGFEPSHQRNTSGSTAVAAQMLAAQRVHMITTNIDPLIAALEQGSLQVKVLGAATEVPDWVMVASPKIKSLDDIKGQRIGFSSLVANDRLFASQFLNAHGIKDNEWHAVQAGRTPAKLAAIENGSTVAGLLGEPSATVALDGGFKLIARISDLGPIPATIYAVSEDWAASQDSGNRLKQALLNTHAWLADPRNKSEATAILIANSKVSQEIADKVWDRYFGSNGIFSKDLTVNAKALDEHMDILKGFGGIKSKPKVDDILLSEKVGGSRD